MSATSDRQAAQIIREFRLFHRRVVGQLDECDVIMKQPSSQKNTMTLEAMKDQLISYQARLDSLLSELIDQDATDAELNDASERARTVSSRIALLAGAIRSAQYTLDPNLLVTRQSMFSSTMNQTSVGLNTSLLQTKMPKLKLPNFDGDERKFLDFKNHFTKMVHENTTLSPLDKLYYLKGALSGKAEKLIRDIPIADQNYETAWAAILERYEDTLTIIESHFNNLFSIKRIQSGKDIQDLIDTVDTALRSLELCGETPQGWPSVITYHVYSRLDEPTKVDWRKTLTDRSKYPSWEVLRNFLKTQATATRTSPAGSNTTKKESKPSDSKSSLAVSTRPCPICGETHLIIDCQRFLELSPSQRLDKIRRNNLCANCFNQGHSNFNCNSRKTCKTCHRKHHTLLHLRQSSSPTKNTHSTSEAKSNATIDNKPKISQEKPAETTESTTNASLKATTSNANVVLLPSALVNFVSNMTFGKLRLLLDTCSQVTLISDAFVRQYRLPIIKSKTPVSLAVGGVKVFTTQQCHIELRSRLNDFKLSIVADIVPSNALLYAIRNLNISEMVKSFREFELADPIFRSPIAEIPNVDLLIGAGHLPDILCRETETRGNCILQNTQFGWTIMGPINNPEPQSECSSHCLLSIQDIDDRLKTFWESENLSEPFVQNNEQSLCERHFDENYTRLPSGHFQVRLPFREPISELANNRRRALCYLKSMERRISSDTQKSYHTFMQEYSDLGHMSIATSSIAQRYFIPYLAVLRATSTTTKFRVVFNASAKTPSGKSLNDILMTGPCLQPELFEILINFRTHAVAFTADIAKMYRCVMVHPDDRPIQSILWRDNPNAEPTEYELNTITYGTSPASFLATKCLEKLAESCKNRIVQNAIKHNFYMDDLLTGAATIEEAIALFKDVHETLAGAHFILRKYQSNSEVLLNSIPPELIETQLTKTIAGKEAISVLGMEWIPKEDNFRIKLPKISNLPKILTKRIILSESAKFFDPLGFISPISVREKIFIQRLWREGLTWDQEVPSRLAEEFVNLRVDLNLLESYVIPRPYDIHPVASANIIGFCDASTKAFCAVVYVRSHNYNQSPIVRFVCSKTRVAPLKDLTIPKLELSAALLLAKLIERVRNILQIRTVFAFSDSTIVLSWLAKPPETWKVFVANRTAKIHEIISFKDSWGYVPTSENPADLGTRGLSVKTFLSSRLWLEGPSFLQSEFTLSKSKIIDPNLEIEKRKTVVACNLSVDDVNYFIQCVERFSNFNHLVRSISYVNRFIARTRPNNKSNLRDTPKTKSLTSVDLLIAEKLIIKITQMYYFCVDYDRLLQGKRVGQRSVLRSHNPFLDDDLIIRSATRLTNADVSYERKRPIILSAKSHFIRLLIRHLHAKYYHATRAFIITQVQSKFVVTGGLTNVVKHELRSCVVCLRYSSIRNHQIMGDLPKERLTISRPFSIVGIDFAGPFVCKPMAKRSTVRLKSYVAVFVCFASRAVHLELVPSLSTEDFLKAFKRFVSRRGLPNTVYSDNGTNFKGAANHLNFQAEAIQDMAANERIIWKFNPPYAPHRGGLWEAAVKSMKRHLLKVTNGHALNFDELCTILTQVEAILNSRPIAYRQGTSSEFGILCPSHLLIGDNLLAVPEEDGSPVKLSIQYKSIRQKISSFWHQWSKDYLAQLRSREKWQKTVEPIRINDIVLIRSESTRPANWPLAKVIAIYPDQHGIPRTVKLQCGSSEKVRDCSSLIRLPLDEPLQASSLGEHVGN